MDQSAAASPNRIGPRETFLSEGEVLRFERVTRYDMGFYMCIASNGVPPSVSQRIFLPVTCKYQSSSSLKEPAPYTLELRGSNAASSTPLCLLCNN